MQYQTTITKQEDIIIDVDPLRILREIRSLNDRYYDEEKGLSGRIAFIAGVPKVQFIERGISHGHYDVDDKIYYKDLPEGISQEKIDLLKAIDLVIDSLEEK